MARRGEGWRALSPSEHMASSGGTSQNPTSHLARPGDSWRLNLAWRLKNVA
ncbi:hypothetical protein A2U01_0072018 [Trifolium medium]|uniref:Uncharacterized protein n=1 Tax=Trifolium medium TaxID=97028 RepID=A0A392SRD3_9FABA|nr:hypothetical protein [Trifolium medium]